jgi:hypothetical protein
MRFTHIARVACLMAPVPLPAAVPAGTTFEVRLLTRVSSYYSKPGDEVRAVVAEPVCAESGNSFPAGTIVRGVVKTVRRVGLGLVHETAKVDLQFREVQLAEGGPQPIAARLISVDNARERVDRNGAIHGIRATATLSNRIGERLALAMMSHPLGLIPIFAVESALLRFPDPEIDYRPGTEFDLELERPLSLPAVSGCVNRIAPLDQSLEVRDMVARLPLWTYTQRQHKAMDPTNLMFVGSEGELDRAFGAAGWTGSRSLSPWAALGVVRAIAEDHSDADAPMRTLLLDDREPDMYRQKALNTFAKRHHIRFWKQPEKLDGATVWASTATWDIATTFSFRYGFTHQVQTNVDLERDKVVRDLAFTGCVDEVAYVTRPEAPVNSESAPRKGLWTDGRVAVVLLNSCNPSPQAPGPSIEYRQPPLSVRCVRRFTLTVRNHFIRDNLVWRSGEGAYLAYRAARDWRRQRIANRMPGDRALHAPSMPLGGGSELNGALGLMLGL